MASREEEKMMSGSTPEQEENLPARDEIEGNPDEMAGEEVEPQYDDGDADSLVEEA